MKNNHSRWSLVSTTTFEATLLVSISHGLIQRLCYAIRSNEPYICQANETYERTTANPKDIDWVISGSKQPNFAGYDIVPGNNDGFKMTTRLEYLPSKDPLITSWINLGPNLRLFGMINSSFRDAPAGMAIYTTPKLKEVWKNGSVFYFDKDNKMIFEEHRENWKDFDRVTIEPVFSHNAKRFSKILFCQETILEKVHMIFFSQVKEVSQDRDLLFTEIRAGVTTFLTTAYILFVNVSILSQAITFDGAPEQIFTTTALAAGFGSIAMGVIAGYPFGLAPGMGVNAYFTFSVVLGMGISWQAALGATFLSGLIFIVISVTGLRALIVEAIPITLQRATTAGIGVFLAIVGLETAQVIVDHPATLVTLGSVKNPHVILFLFGTLVTCLLMRYQVTGAILLGILSTSLLAAIGGFQVYNGQAFAGFERGLFALPTYPKDLIGALDIRGAVEFGIWGVVFTFFFVDFLDTAGSLIGLAHKANYVDENNKIPRANQIFLSDALATVFASLIGTSTTTTYIESAAGIEEGGRTGVTALVIGLLFLTSLLFWPFFSIIPSVATSPVLIIVGGLMMGQVKWIDWDDITEAVPAFFTIIMMPLTYSIATGISFGIIFYSILSFTELKKKKTNFVVHLLSIILVIRLIYMSN